MRVFGGGQHGVLGRCLIIMSFSGLYGVLDERELRSSEGLSQLAF